MLQLNDNNFEQEIKKRKLVLVDFYATWCGPCGMQAQVLNKIENSRSIDCDIVKVNVDDSTRVSTKYGIDSIPTLMIFKNNKLVKRVVGYTEEQEILKILETFRN